MKKDVPVKVNFRAVGEVGCGNTISMPTGPEGILGAQLTSATDMKVIEFTPQTAGDFEFYCTTRCYRGVMVVKE